MGQIKNIKLHIVTDIKKKKSYQIRTRTTTMSSAKCEALMIESGSQETLADPAEDVACESCVEEIVEAEEPAADTAEELAEEPAVEEEPAEEEPAAEEPAAEEPEAVEEAAEEEPAAEEAEEEEAAVEAE